MYNVHTDYPSTVTKCCEIGHESDPDDPVLVLACDVEQTFTY
jgi:hypothetical protein